MSAGLWAGLVLYGINTGLLILALRDGELSPDGVARGGENGAEMGVFNRVGAPFKRDGLNAKIAEYMPFGLAPVTVIQT